MNRLATQKRTGTLEFFRSGSAGVAQRVGEAERLPLVDAERVVGQHLHAADVRERADEFARPPEVVFAVREAGHEDAADPDGRAEFGEVARTVENGRVVRARERTMRVRVEAFSKRSATSAACSIGSPPEAVRPPSAPQYAL